MLENLYLSMPYVVQNLLISIASIPLKLRRKSTELPRLTQLSDLSSYHQKLLRESLTNALNSSYWHQLINLHSVNIDSGNLTEELKKLPLLSKSDVRVNSADLAIKMQNTIFLKTSGTSGAGLKLTTTKFAESIMWTFFERYRTRFGIVKSDWCGYFCGRTIKKVNDNTSPNWRINYIGKQILFSNYHLSDNTIEDYISALNKYQPPWIHGYPSFLSLLSKLALEKGLVLLYTPKSITLGSESVSLNQKKVINSFFKSIPSELYCQTEGVAIISQCEFDNLHVEEDFSFVEFIPLETDQSLFEIVGTSFYNKSFPLFRYRTGDIVELSSEKCKCGNLGRVVKSIDGRKEDVLVLPNGTNVGRLDHIFKDMVNINEAQIFQKKDLSVIFRVVKGNGYNLKDEVQLVKEIQKRLSEDVIYTINYVDNIEKTSSGKLRFVIKESV